MRVEFRSRDGLSLRGAIHGDHPPSQLRRPMYPTITALFQVEEKEISPEDLGIVQREYSFIGFDHGIAIYEER